MKNRFVEMAGLFLSISILNCCGVKGKPLPPLEAPPLSRNNQPSTIYPTSEAKKQNLKSSTKASDQSNQKSKTSQE